MAMTNNWNLVLGFRLRYNATFFGRWRRVNNC